MPRYFYAVSAVAGIVLAVGLFWHKTPPTLSAAQASLAEFGGVSFRLEYATSTVDQERGLGGRASIPSDYGMLFIFQKDSQYGFWMKDMLTPIDIFWLDDKGQVIYISENVATSTYPHVFYPSAPARYVLETASGFAHAHSIATGTVLRLKN